MISEEDLLMYDRSPVEEKEDLFPNERSPVEKEEDPLISPSAAKCEKQHLRSSSRCAPREAGRV